MIRRLWYLAFLAVNNWPALLVIACAAGDLAFAVYAAGDTTPAVATALGFAVVQTLLVSALIRTVRVGGGRSAADVLAALADDLADLAGMDRIENINPWPSARTLADLGECTARWLEGTLETHPGYCGRPDAETAEIVDALTFLNRHGLLTTGSQPGLFDRHGKQRAVLHGLCDRATAEYLAGILDEAGMVVAIAGPGRFRKTVGHLPASVRTDGTVCASWGVLESSREEAAVFASGAAHRSAVRAVRRAWRLSVVDPQWGRGDLLWGTLVGALSTTTPGGDMLPVGYTADGAPYEVPIGRTRPLVPEVGTIRLGKSTKIALTPPKLDTLSAEAFADAYPSAPYTVHLPDRDPEADDRERQAADPLGALRAYVDGWWDGAPRPYITGEHDLRVDPAGLVACILTADLFAAPDLVDLLECRDVPDEAPRSAHEGLGLRWALLIGGPLPREVIEVMRERYGYGVTVAILAEAEHARKGLVS